MHGIAVEIGVGEQLGGLLEIHDGKVELLVILVDPGAAPDDLLEFREGFDAFIQHDQLAGLGIHAGGEQFRGGDDDRVTLVRHDEIVEFRLALGVVAGDPHDVLVVLGGQIGVFVHQGLPHPFGVVDILAEDNGLGKPVGGFEELGDLARHQGGALFQHQAPVEVTLVVDAVLDELPMLVAFPLLRPVAHEILVDIDANDLVRRQEPILDALSEGIGIDRLAEVIDVRDVAGLARGGGESDLGGGLEVVEDFPPGRVFVGTAPVTFVHHDQIEEAR